MSDIVERLWQHIGLDQLDEGDMVALVPRWEVEEAAAEIERLREQIGRQYSYAAGQDEEIERLREVIRLTYKTACGRDFERLELPEAVAAARQADADEIERLRGLLHECLSFALGAPIGWSSDLWERVTETLGE